MDDSPTVSSRSTAHRQDALAADSDMATTRRDATASTTLTHLPLHTTPRRPVKRALSDSDGEDREDDEVDEDEDKDERSDGLDGCETATLGGDGRIEAATKDRTLRAQNPLKILRTGVSSASSSLLEDGPTSATPFTCTLPPGCSAAPTTFDTSSALFSHYQKHHAYVCSVEDCKRVFPDEHFLNLHIREFHDPLVAIQREQGKRTVSGRLPAYAIPSRPTKVTKSPLAA